MERASDIRRTLGEAGLTLKKRWGQNFLVDPAARDRLLGLLGAAPGETVWEIGGGGGALSTELVGSCGRLVVFEIDHGLVRLLSRRLEGSSAVVVPGDFCRTWRAALERHGPPARVLGNLPYQSASRIIALLATAPLRPRRLVLTVQRELGQRMSAKPSTKAYSSFSVLCQAVFEVRAAADLGPASFYPAPNVVSRIMVLEPRAGVEPDLPMLQAITRGLFSTRRKTMGRTLRGMGPLGEAVRQALVGMGIRPETRPEELGVPAWLELSRRVREIRAGGSAPPVGAPQA